MVSEAAAILVPKLAALLTCPFLSYIEKKEKRKETIDVEWRCKNKHICPIENPQLKVGGGGGALIHTLMEDETLVALAGAEP